MSNLHKRQIYAGLLEIIKDNKYYYYSKMGSEYSHLTDDGKLAIIEYMNHVGPYMMKKNEQELEALAKQKVWGELTK